MSALLDKNPAYRAVQIIKVDWDKHAQDDITRELKVASRATLVMFTGGKEVGRVVFNSNPGDIGKLFDAAIA